MENELHWKLLIAGTVGGACLVITSLLVFGILVCRHRLKQARLDRILAEDQLSRQRWSVEHSEVDRIHMNSRVYNGHTDNVFPVVDLSIPLPGNVNVQNDNDFRWHQYPDYVPADGSTSNRTPASSFDMHSLLAKNSGSHIILDDSSRIYSALDPRKQPINTGASQSLNSTSLVSTDISNSLNYQGLNSRPQNSTIGSMSPTDLSSTLNGEQLWNLHRTDRHFSRAGPGNTRELSNDFSTSMQLVDMNENFGTSESEAPLQQNFLFSSCDEDPVWIRRTLERFSSINTDADKFPTYNVSRNASMPASKPFNSYLNQHALINNCPIRGSDVRFPMSYHRDRRRKDTDRRYSEMIRDCKSSNRHPSQ